MDKTNKIILAMVIVVLCFLLAINNYKNSYNPKNIDTADNFIRIALVTDPLEGNNQFIMQAYNELLAVDLEYQLETAHLEGVDTYTWTEGTREFCEKGYDLIIGLGWQATVSFTNLSYEYPNTQFAVVDTPGDDFNVRGVTYEVSDGCFVLGAMLATAFPDENLFGYIGNFDDSGNFAYQSGFRQGVLSVNPNAEFAITFAQTYSDTALVKESAQALKEQGVSVIMGSVSSSANEGLYEYCLEQSSIDKPMYATGLSVDQTRIDNPYIIGGVTKDTSVPVRVLVEELLNGEFTNDDISLGLSDGGFGIIHINEQNAHFRNDTIITDEVINVGQETFEGIISGSINYIPEKFK